MLPANSEVLYVIANSIEQARQDWDSAVGAWLKT